MLGRLLNSQAHSLQDLLYYLFKRCTNISHLPVIWYLTVSYRFTINHSKWLADRIDSLYTYKIWNQNIDGAFLFCNLFRCLITVSWDTWMLITLESPLKISFTSGNTSVPFSALKTEPKYEFNISLIDQSIISNYFPIFIFQWSNYIFSSSEHMNKSTCPDSF